MSPDAVSLSGSSRGGRRQGQASGVLQAEGNEYPNEDGDGKTGAQLGYQGVLQIIGHLFPKRRER